MDLSDPRWKKVLSVAPGITDLATLVYRDEEAVLASAASPETHYRSVVLPEKLKLNITYLEQRSRWSDLKLLALTVRYSFLPAGFKAESIQESLIG